jgi:hypothetical protein
MSLWPLGSSNMLQGAVVRHFNMGSAGIVTFALLALSQITCGTVTLFAECLVCLQAAASLRQPTCSAPGLWQPRLPAQQLAGSSVCGSRP